MLPRFCASSVVSAARLGLAFLGLAVCGPSAVFASPAPGFQALPGHIPAAALASAQKVSALDARLPVALALTLPLHHQAELADLLRGLYNPSDPRYGQFLTPDEFAARFSPTPTEYARVTAYARAMGLTVTGTHSNRTVLDVSAPAGQVERAFGLHLLVYQSQKDGRYFFAPDAEPQVPSTVAGLVTGVVGLSSASQWQPHLVQKSIPELAPDLDPYAVTPEAGTGPGGGLAPADIKAAYNLTSVSQTGSGQTLGLLELDGYTASDITSYESAFGLPNTALQNILVDGFNGIPSNTSGSAEVTLDIELQQALAPNASKILVYEAPNSGTGVVDTYNKIATDNLAKEISTSWGEPEQDAPAGVRSSENTAFQQMAAQGQSIFAASGDSGANDNGSSLSVDDPASQPYMVGVGGTALTTNGAGGSYKSETTWNNSIGAGGGGISTVWTIPSYQSGVVGSAASKGSTTYRNVPDVSLDADPKTGYSIYYNGGWSIYGGTSCAAPLWASFTALVNQRRLAAGSSSLGFANPPIYTLAASSAYATDFHDIADGSTNTHYPAVTGYDDATGWGSFNGVNLLSALGGGAAPAAPTGLTATAGSAQVSLSWSGSTGATSYTLYRGTSSGSETLLKSGLTPTNFTDTGLTAGTTYFYQVSAVNSVGTSAKSNEANATPKVVQVRFVPRSGFEYRMVGGVFQGSPDNSTWTTLATVTQTPASGQYTALPATSDPATFRYLRYLAPDGTYGNIAELEFDSNGVKLTGTGFGTSGSYYGNGYDFTKALDGDVSSYFDAPYPGNGDFVGIDQGAPVTPNTGQVRFAPRPGYGYRMVGGQFQGSADGSSYTTLATVAQAPADGQYSVLATSADPATFRYLRYLAPDGTYGNIAELEFDSNGVKLTGTGFGTTGSYYGNGYDFTKALDGDVSSYFDAPYPGNGDFVGVDRGVPASSYTKLTGTQYGTSGSYNNSGSGFAQAFDGNFNTFFDAPYPGNADFAGLDLGSGNMAAVTRIRYAPRAGYESRMVGGAFQGSNDNSNWTLLYTVSVAPPSGALTQTTAISSSMPFRYLRYLAPDGAYGNIAELEFDTSP